MRAELAFSHYPDTSGPQDYLESAVEFLLRPRQRGSLQGGAGFHTRVIREARLHVQGNLETVVEFLLRLRRPGAFAGGSLARPEPARMAPFIAGADSYQGCPVN
jgi:hypothetical protein